MSKEETVLGTDEMDHFKSIMMKLDSMRKENRHCDLKINVEGKVLHVHKDVLCASSNYFDAMFSHDTLEKLEGIVTMKNVEFTAFQKCIDFIYTGKLSISFDQCFAVLLCASVMQLDKVCDEVDRFLEYCLNGQNIFQIHAIAEKFSLTFLEKSCEKFAIDNIVAISKLDEFNMMDIGFLIRLISTNATSEDIKLACALQWVNADLDNRLVHLEKLLECLNALDITPGYCRLLMKEEQLCRTSNNLVKFLFMTPDTERRTSSGPLEIPSLLNNVPSSIILINTIALSVNTYFPSNGKCFCVADYESCMNDAYFTCCATKNTLYVITTQKEVVYLDLDSFYSWLELPSTIHNHGQYLQCDIVDDHIYVGGQNFLERLNLVEGEAWQEIDLGGNICNKSGLVRYQDSLVLVGGEQEGERIADVKAFSGSQWYAMDSMNFDRVMPSVVVLDTMSLFVCGGSLLDNLEVYDTNTKHWTIISCTNMPRSPFLLCTIDSRLFAVECHPQPFLFKVFDKYKGSWRNCKHRPCPKLKVYPGQKVTSCTGKRVSRYWSDESG